MPQIIATGQVNVPALGADDAYVQIVAPPPFVTGAATDVIGVVGTASWGPVNTPVHLGSGQDAQNAFGAISAAALTDPYDIATDLYIAFGQSSSQSTLEGFGVRVTDGTDTAASYTLQGAASPAGKSVILAGTITSGQTSTLTIASTSLPTNVLVGYENVSGDTLGTTATGLAAAVNANAALASVGITAQASGDDVNVYAPSSVTFTVTGSVSSNGTLTFTSGTAAATTNGGTISGIFTGILGNQMQIKVATGTQPSTFNVTLIPPVGLSETYPNIPSATFWASLQTAINSGMSTYRGKSLCGKMTGATPAVGAPATGTYTLSGGTDGRAGVTTSTLVGSETATPQTGLFALSAVSPAVGIAWMVGCNDLTPHRPSSRSRRAPGRVRSIPDGDRHVQRIRRVLLAGDRRRRSVDLAAEGLRRFLRHGEQRHAPRLAVRLRRRHLGHARPAAVTRQQASEPCAAAPSATTL